MIITIVLGLLALVWLLDALRLRGRLAALPALAPGAADPPADDFVLAAAPGVTIDEATRRAAAAHARQQGIDVLDLLPADLPAWRTLMLVSTVDPVKYRAERFAPGRSAGYAMLVARSLLARVTPATAVPPRTAVGLYAWAHELKYYAMTRVGFAVAPSLRAPADSAAARLGFARGLFGSGVTMILTIQVLLYGLGLTGPFLSWPVGLVALAILHVQPLIVTAGTAVRPRDLVWHALLRTPRELYGIVQMALAPADADALDPVAVRRPVYEELAEAGTEHLFEARREDCPICGARELGAYLHTVDLLQQKPGEFTVERCGGCGHLFQNPRLSIDGLNYYYKDFYDGLGEQGIDAIFAFKETPYLNRARVVDGLATPRRWLDVGAGHGHFCCVARDVWPNARFDGLDLSESIEEAERRGWIDHGYRGMFPDMAPELRARGEHYDVVSMSHYLEHTRDPRAEIVAAHEILDDQGLLFIEVPDPESRMRHFLGRFWVPWFQPQHQHYLSVKNIERLLREEGFEPVRWHRGEAHQPVDFLFGAMLAMQSIAPREPRPWLPAPTAADRFYGGVVFWVGLPLVGCALLLDMVLDRPLRRGGAGWSNTYRVVARKQPALPVVARQQPAAA